MDSMVDDLKNIDNEFDTYFGVPHETFRETKQITQLIKELPNIYDNEIKFEANYESFMCIFNQYQEQPHLLNPYLQTFIDSLLELTTDDFPTSLKHKAFKYLYVITKVRGYKFVIRYFPHEITYFEPILRLLESQDPSDHATWESRYILLLWFSMLALVPFDISRFDGAAHKAGAQRILSLIKEYLCVGDKARDAAAFLAGRFLTRPDIHNLYMEEFLDWSMVRLVNGGVEASGILLAMAHLFKIGRREDLKPFALICCSRLLEFKLSENYSALVHKMFLKLLQRIGLSFLPTRVASWRYQRGCRSLADNLASAAEIKSHGAGDALGGGDSNEDFDVAPEIEDILEELLKGLCAKDTIVRWSAAKGVGRIVERLPKDLGDEVVRSVLDLMTAGNEDSALHGACLALAELGRRGALLPLQLPAACKAVLRALFFDEVRGNYSVGANIRDAACYVLWSFARTFEPSLLQPHMGDIAGGLVVTALFDREVNCRRAASAAYQEHVGRQGALVPHGIEVLTLADYQNVGNRANCYLKLSCQIGKFPEYCHGLIDHLVQHKVGHPDPTLRGLAAQALGNLTATDPEYMARKVVPRLLSSATSTNLSSRHGTLLTLAHVSLALATLKSDLLDKSSVQELTDLPNNLDKKKMLRGLGAEMMRVAICTFIEKISLAKLPLNKATMDCWRKILDLCVQQTEESVRTAAVSALGPFYSHYYSPLPPSSHSEVLTFYLSEIEAGTSGKVEALSGLLAAIGALPTAILKANFGAVVETLVASIQGGWPESRREAIRALAASCRHVDFRIARPHISAIYRSLLLGLQDYTVDSRGDIGSIVREAAMEAALDVTRLVVFNDAQLIPTETVERLIGSLLRQCVERINRTRGVAGKTLAHLVYCKPEVRGIPFRSQLEECCPQPVEGETLVDWSSPSYTFPTLVPLLALPPYTQPILIGLVTSVGDLTESLVIHARDSLFTYIGSLQGNEAKLVEFYNALLQVLSDNFQDERIVLPCLRTWQHILNSGLVSEDPHFPTVQLADLVKSAVGRSSNPQKLIAGVEVWCGLLGVAGKDDAGRRRALSHILIILCHRYPRVRKAAASQLYEALLTSFTSLVQDESNLETAMSLLSETDWAKCVDDIRPIRNELSKLLGLPPPVLVAKKK